MKKKNRLLSLFAVAKGPTPILNTPDFNRVFSGEGGLSAIAMNRALETIAFPDTKFRVLAAENIPFALKVETSEYPYGAFYIDRRFVDLCDTEPLERVCRLPSRQEILERMKKLLGIRYVWGGNWPAGIALSDYYVPSVPWDVPEAEEAWSLRGVDCSGLLYYATDGYIPRNTSSLIKYGVAIPIDGFAPSKIISGMQPLDLIVWKGHVIVISEGGKGIESRGGYGVIETPLEDLMAQLFERRSRGEISEFFVRRWYTKSIQKSKF